MSSSWKLKRLLTLLLLASHGLETLSAPSPMEDSIVIPFAPEEKFRDSVNRKHPGAYTKTANKKGPSVGTSPLDPNETVAHTLETLNSILGTAGGSVGGLVQGLTGISIHDCAGDIKGKNLNTLTCQQFLAALSECESLANLKPLLQQAKKNYRKKPKSKKPCFKN